MNFTKSATDLVNAVYDLLHEDPSAAIHDSATVLSKLNERQNVLASKNYLPFVKKEKVLNVYLPFYVYEDTVAGAVSMKITAASGLPASGKVKINGNTVTYTSITVGTTYDTLVGTTGISAEIKQGTQGFYMYPMDSDFGYLTIMYVNDQEHQHYKTLRKFMKGSAGYIDFFDNKVQYICIKGLSANDDVFLEYQAIPTAMSAIVDPVIPDEFTNVLEVGAAILLLLPDDDPDGSVRNFQVLFEQYMFEMQNAINNQFTSQQSLEAGVFPNGII